MALAKPVTEFELHRQELLSGLSDDDRWGAAGRLDEIPRLAADAADEQLRRAPATGAWSAWQVLSRLADSDLMAGLARLVGPVWPEAPMLRTVVAQPASRLPGGRPA